MNERPPTNPEGSQEKILSKQEVLEALLPYISNVSGAEILETSITRELSDGDGLYLLEVARPGAKEGEVDEYRYMRAGTFGRNSTDTTHLAVVNYDSDGMPVGGYVFSELNEKTKEWEVVF